MTGLAADILGGYGDRVWCANTVRVWLTSLGVFAAIWAVTWVFKRGVIRHLEAIARKTSGDLDDFVVGQLGRLRIWFFASVSLYFSTRHLTLPDWLHAGIRNILVVTLGVHAILFLQRLVNYALEKSYLKNERSEPASLATVRTIQVVVRWVIWAVGLLFLLDNLGYEVTTIAAGLGLGGVAVALAAQAILGDLFSAFCIFLDKPFKVGDLIVVGDLRGTVESIGLKTTRLRSFDGDQLVFSNADLTSSRIRNFQQMRERRVVFRVGVTYQTPSGKLQAIPGIVREAVSGVPNVRLDRVHFAAFGPSSLDFEIAYFVLSPDPYVYMNVQQAILFGLKERFDADGIAFAYPTQTVYLEKNGGG